MSVAPVATVPILLYHSISDRPTAGQGAFAVSPSAFREHVRVISDAGCTALTISAFGTALRNEHPLPSRPVLVTFDDGFADVRSAVDLLLSEGLGATVFVTSGDIGKAPMLTATDVLELTDISPKVEVGAHSVTHPWLDEIPISRTVAEIAASKSAIEEITAIPLKSFAYPHGAYEKRIRAAVIDAGFTAAAAVKNALSHRKDDPFALARVTVTASMSTRRVAMLLAGSDAPISWRGERLRTRGYRSMRRVRRLMERTAA